LLYDPILGLVLNYPPKLASLKLSSKTGLQNWPPKLASKTGLQNWPPLNYPPKLPSKTSPQLLINCPTCQLTAKRLPIALYEAVQLNKKLINCPTCQLTAKQLPIAPSRCQWHVHLSEKSLACFFFPDVEGYYLLKSFACLI
jgi:endogenous inhibitor of DNA gyrase (YacG/DUF329 family)